MLKITLKRLVIFAATGSLLSTTFIGAANAAMVGLQEAITMEERAEYVSDIEGWLSREEVQEELIAMGVDPVAAGERVAAMTSEELHALHGKIDQLPAGALGAVEVIGIVFIVLLILELMGITHVFTGI